MWLSGLRDVAIILLAAESIVIGLLLVITLVQIRTLLRVLREEIKPLLESANDTVTTVRGTTHIVSETVVRPLVTVASYAVGTRQAVRSLLAIGQNVRRRSEGKTGTQGRETSANKPSEEV